MSAIDRWMKRLIRADADAFATILNERVPLLAALASPMHRLCILWLMPEMFVVLSEIMIKARRDPEIFALVAIPLEAWRNHIVSLISLGGANESNKAARSEAARSKAD